MTTIALYFGIPISENSTLSLDQLKEDNPDAHVFATKEDLVSFFPGGPCTTCAYIGIHHFIGYPMPEGKDRTLKGFPLDGTEMLWTLTLDSENVCTNIISNGYKEFYDRK